MLSAAAIIDLLLVAQDSTRRIFVLGMWCALGGAKTLAPLIHSRAMLVLAVGYLVFAFDRDDVACAELGRFVPSWLAHALYPIDKTNLDPLRLAVFAFLASRE